MDNADTSEKEGQITWATKPLLAWILLACVAGLACIGFLFQRRSTLNQSQRVSSEPPLVIAPADLNVGRVYDSDAHHHKLRITNATEEPVTILRFLTSCDCAGISPAGGVTLKPHETRLFTITLSLVWKGYNQRIMDPEPFHVNFAALCVFDEEALPPLTAGMLGLLASPLAKGSLLATSAFHPAGWAGHRDQRLDWRLSGEVIPTILFRTPSIYLGTQSDHQRVIEGTAEILASPEISAITCSSEYPWDVTAIAEKQVSSPRRFRLAVRSRGQVTRRHVDEAVQVVPVNRQNQKLPGKRIRILGDIDHDVLPTPPEVQFGRHACGTSGEEAIVLQSLTHRRFQVLTVSPSSRKLTIVPAGAKDGRSLFSLGLRFSQTGSHQLTAEFKIRDEDGTTYPITLPIRYYGAAEPSE